MNRKQFLLLLVALVLLAAAGAGVHWSDRLSWQRGGTRLGQKLLPTLKIAEVAEIAVRDAKSEVHIFKQGAAWKVRERADFPADVDRIADLLLKAVELKIVQTEGLSETQRTHFELVEPRPGAAGEGTGTVLELKDASGKALARLLLGKKLMKRTEVQTAPGAPPHAMDMPAGRYLLSGGDAAWIAVVSEPLNQVEATPAAWLSKAIFHIDRVQSVAVAGPDGKSRWTLARAKEGDLWSFAGLAEKPDPQKAEDVVSPLYEISLADVVADPAKVPTGLDKPVVAHVQTFDDLTYALKIGAKAGDDRYYAQVAQSGEPPKVRTPEKGESASDKDKRDKEFAEQRSKLLRRLERERRFEQWSYELPKATIERLTYERVQLMPDKKKSEKK